MAEDAAPVWHFGAKKSLHVFSEDDSGTHVNNSICDDVEQPPLVLGGFAFASAGDWLARPAEAENPSSHDRSVVEPGESADAWENRRCIEQSRFHFRNKIGDGINFPLAVTNGDKVRDNSTESKADAVVSGTKTDVRDDGRIRTHGIVLVG